MGVISQYRHSRSYWSRGRAQSTLSAIRLPAVSYRLFRSYGNTRLQSCTKAILELGWPQWVYPEGQPNEGGD